MTVISPRARIAHLLRRAGFGATVAELDEYVTLGFEASVDRLLNPQRIAEPALDARLAALVLDPIVNPQAFAELQLEWLYRMVNTRRPLLEKMALFWHGHFATANSKVNSPFLMRLQYQTFLSLGLGNFRDLVIAVSKDPAMLVWLDGVQNRKGAPNENYGRELLELFMLGIGNYTENDVKAVARAFTGWTFTGERSTAPGRQFISAQFVFQPRQHDTDPKTFLGQTITNTDGLKDGLDVLDIALKQPACARFVVGKLFSFFVWDSPDTATLAPFIATFTKTFDLRETLRAMLLSPAFSSEQAYRAKIKGPIEQIAGLLRVLGVTSPTRDMLVSARRMGQDLFNPPNVGGWTSGLGWVGSGTVLERVNFANRLVTARQNNQNNAPLVFDPAKLLAGQTFTTPEQLADYVIGLLLDGDASTEQRAALVNYLRLDEKGKPGTFTLDARTLDSKVRGLIHLVASTPAYQLN